jgi:hypothetical protein
LLNTPEGGTDAGACARSGTVVIPKKRVVMVARSDDPWRERMETVERTKVLNGGFMVWNAA